MTKLLQYVLSVCALAVTGALLILCLHVSRAVDAWGASAMNLQPTLDKANATLDAINGPRGTLHEVNKAVVKIGDAIVTTQMQERKIAPATIAAVNSLATIAPHANQTMDALTGTAQGATETLGEGKRTIAAAQPLLASLTRTSDASTLTVQHFDALVTSPDLVTAMHHAADMTGSGNTILANAATVSTKAKDDYLKARTPFGRFVTTGLDLIHLSAYAAR
jgi:ABC-type transporter Mla subunit MlaD